MPDIRDHYQVLINLLQVDILYTQPATRIFQLDSKSFCELFYHFQAVPEDKAGT